MRLVRTIALAAATGLAWPALGADAPSGGLRGLLDRGKEGIAGGVFGLQVGAFGDALWARDPETGRGRLDWGAAELDLGLDLHPDLQSAAAVVWTREQTLLTVGFLDFHLLGGRIAPRGRIWAEKGFHLQAGRFDVPFGSDWQFFASKDSVSISRPLTTSAIMDGGYNDAGVRALGNDGTFTFQVYALRGFSKGRLYGGRIGVMPFGNPFSLKDGPAGKVAEFGLSAFYDRDGSGRSLGRALAWDAEFRGSVLQVRGEYLDRRWNPVDGEPGHALRGWHLTVEVPLQDPLGWPVTVFSRVERNWAAPPGEADPGDARLAAGFALPIAGVLQLKAEVQRWTAVSAATRGEASRGGTQGFASLVWVF